MDTLPVLSEHVIFTDFPGSEGVLLNLNTHQYFKLNETGTLVWRALEAGQTRSDVIALLTREYEVTTEDAAASVQALYQKLVAHGLLELA